MNETFRAEENQRYQETYRSKEYNRSEETFGSSELFRSAEYRGKDAGSGEPSAKRSSEKSSAKALRRRRGVMTGGILSATGAVAGAAVIAVAITVMAALNVTAVFSDVTSHSVLVNFLIENTAEVPLTACLQNEGKQYQLELDSNETVCQAYFDFLVPDTEYLLTVKDGKAAKSQIVTGGFAGNGVVVTSGLEPGDVVIVEGAHKVSTGMPVKILE